MADVTIPGLSTQLTSVDRAADLLEVSDTSDSGNSKKSSVNNLLDITGHPVGDTDTATLTNKTITAPAISSPVLSGTVTGAYTIGGTPTFPSAVVTLTGSQTLTNKVLTSPTINAPTITNPTLTTDTVSEFTAAAGVTIDGVLLKDSKISGTYISDDSITGAQINWSGTGVDSGIWWEELGRTTLAGSADSITVNIAAKKYLKVFCIYASTGGTVDAGIRFNADSGNNYAYRFSSNGGADSTSTSQSYVILTGATTVLKWDSTKLSVYNIAADEKLGYYVRSSVGTAGAGTAPARLEGPFKWANTSAQITSVSVHNLAGTGDFAIGTELIVMGHN